MSKRDLFKSVQEDNMEDQLIATAAGMGTDTSTSPLPSPTPNNSYQAVA